MYLIKLQIEMNMADLIVKIVRASAPTPGHGLHRYAASQQHIPRPKTRSRTNSDKCNSRLDAVISCDSKEASSQVPLEALPSPEAAESSSWELKQMPSYFDAHDVICSEKRRDSEVEETAEMVAFPLPVRPSLMRNMSEMTQLEIGAGYLNIASRERKSAAMATDSLC